MTKFILMCGLPGSGKSTIARQLAEQSNARIIESDSYREKISGDASIQGNNTELFDIIHKDIIDTLKSGEDVIFDATNISRKHRLPIIEKVSKISGVKKICVLVATPYDVCVAQNNSRNRVVPKYIIRRMRENFNVPLYSEGWDEIIIKYSPYDFEKYSFTDFIDRTMGFDQNNHNHSMTLGNHCRSTGFYMYHMYTKNQFEYIVSVFHDNGKEYTKVEKNIRGEPSNISHYYNHENVGAYESLFYLHNYDFSDSDVIRGAGIIEHHMRPYFCSTEKAKKKLLNTVGKEIYDFLWKLNDCDRKAH